MARKRPIPDYQTPKDPGPCPFCGRPLRPPTTKHHLIPISRGGSGTPTFLLHKICHDKIHRVLSEKELKKFYHTFKRLRSHPDLHEFIEWVRKKEPEYYDVSVRQKR